jgi:hypothetical protein
LKLAVTAVSAFILNEQLPVPEQAPLQPVKVDPEPGAAVSVTAVPCVYAAEHVDPQLMPDGELVTVPLPVPALLTVSVRFTGAASHCESAALYATSNRP